LCLRLAGDREGWSRLLDEVDANPGDPRINDEVKIMVPSPAVTKREAG